MVYERTLVTEIRVEEGEEAVVDVELGQQTVTADLSVTPHEVKTFYKSLPKDSLPIVNTEFELEQIVIKPKIEELEILRIKDKHLL